MDREWTLREACIVFDDEQRRPEDVLQQIEYTPHKNELVFQLLKAKALFEVGDFEQALQQCIVALKSGYEIPEVYVLKGRCLYKLEEYETALDSFLKAQEIKPSPETTRCIERCHVRIAANTEEVSRRILRFEPPPSSSINKEWYQTNDSVSVSIYLKNVLKSNLSVTFKANSFELIYNQMQPPFVLNVKLSKEIDPNDCKVNITPTKVEIKMKKAKPGEKWSTLDVPN